MSDMNQKDYDGANACIVGRAGGPVQVKKFDKGGSQAELSIAVGKGYKKNDEWVDTGTDWYTLTATEEWANQNWPDIQKGDKVRLDDTRLEFKPYAKKDGTPGVEASLRYGTVVIVEAKSDRSGGSSSGSSGGVTPF